MTATTKYEELRSKTDRQLMQLIDAELELGICFAREITALGHKSAEQRRRVAHTAHRTAGRLLNLTADIGAAERSRLESKLAYLGEMLAVPAWAPPELAQSLRICLL